MTYNEKYIIIPYRKNRKQDKVQKIHAEDIWDVKYAFCKWIIPRLIELKRTNNGYPGTMTPKQWDKLQDQMIEGFREGIKEFENGKCNEKKLQKALDIFHDNFEHLWD